jgi:hypothetical protein
MPAINPAQLKLQAAELGEHFADPDRFTNDLHKLLERYADHTYRPGMISGVEIILPTYRVPAPVIPQLVNSLSQQVESHPDEAIALIDRLWAEAYLEFRSLAVRLLPHLASDLLNTIKDRVLTWAAQNEERSISEALVQHGLERMRSEHTPAYLELISKWFATDSVDVQKLGVQALVMLVEMHEFENLPAIFTRIQPVVREAHQDLAPDLLELIAALVRRSAPECTHFLLQLAGEKKVRPETQRLIRRSLPSFSEEDQAKLRGTLST